MPKTVFITGSFGNIGESVVLALFQKKDYRIICFDLNNKRNAKKEKELSKLGEFKTIWGDIRDINYLKSVLTNQIDCIIHLAAIIPPSSETNIELSDSINIGGTLNILKVASQLESKPKVIFTSSVSTFGPRHPDTPLLTDNDPQKATDNYTRQKITCEENITNPSINKLPWTILRLTAIPPLFLDYKSLDILFDPPLDQKIEFAHTRDIGLAIANSIDDKANNKIFLLGGGKKCQTTYREFISHSFNAYGFGELSAKAFRIPENSEDWYYTHWMDTQESQSLLTYQNLTIDDYITDLKDRIGFKRYLFRFFAPIIRWFLVRKSKYYF